MSYFIFPVSMVPMVSLYSFFRVSMVSMVSLKQNNFFLTYFFSRTSFSEGKYNKLFRRDNKRWAQCGHISHISSKIKIAKQLILRCLAIIHRGPTWA